MRYCIIIFLGLLLGMSRASAQFKLVTLDTLHIPKQIKYISILKKCVQWKDSAGSNIVLLTETGKQNSTTPGNEGFANAAILARHYLIIGDSVMLTWKVIDGEEDCPVDITASFLESTFKITDLNNDGIAEVWMMYKTACRSDVSPATMKIIMYEGKTKFAMRGTNRVKEGVGGSYIGGEYVFDDAFKKAPESFRKFAADLWQKNIMETWK
jgi:hypothetical protein